MLKDITLGQYYPAQSALHKMDARVKTVMAILYIVVVFITTGVYGYSFLAAFTFYVIHTSRVPVKYVLKGIKSLLVFITVAAMLNIVFTPGEAFFEVGFVKMTYEGLQLAITMVLRILFLLTGTSMLTLTTSPIELTDAIERLLSPLNRLRVPVHEIAMMMTIALRYIPILLEETDKIMKAQMARGADFESGNLFQRAKAMIPLLVPLFISAFRRAEDLAVAMETRCYRGGVNRTRMKQAKITAVDYRASVCFTIFIAVEIALRFI